MTPFHHLFSFRTLLIFFISFSFKLSFTQVNVPNLINYQAVAHSQNGDLLSNENIDVKIGLFASSANGQLIWEEEHSLTTNDYGLFSLKIGNGVSTGLGSALTASEVNWKGSTHFLNVQIDAGFGYEDLGTQQLVTVPYAFHANTVAIDNVDDADADSTNELISSVIVGGDSLFITEKGIIHSADLSSLKDGVDDADNDPFNEIELPISANNNDVLTWDGAGWVALPAYDDLDGDGIPNNVDNCIATPNPGQSDFDNDGIGNLCDVNPFGSTDLDADGWPSSMDLDDNDANITHYDDDNNPSNEMITDILIDSTTNVLSIVENNVNVSTIDLSSLQDGVDDADNDPSNEYNLQLLLNNNILELTDGGGTKTTDLSSLNGTDNQNLNGASLNGTNLTISIENGSSTTVDLGPIQDGVDDADNDPTNELISNAALGPNDNFIIIDQGNGNFINIDVTDLNDSGTDDQNISGSSFDPSNNQLTIGIESGNAQIVDLSNLDVDIIGGNGIDVTGSSGTYNIVNTGDTNPSDDITNTTTASGDLSGTFPNPTVSQIQGTPIATTTPTNKQVLTFDVSSGTWQPETIAADTDWTADAGIIYNENEDVGIGLNTPNHKLHVEDNSVNATSFNEIGMFETNNNYSIIGANSNSAGDGGGVFLSKYNNNIVSYVGGNYLSTDGDTTSFLGVGSPNQGTGNPELGMRISSSEKSIVLKAEESRIGMDADLQNGTNNIMLASNNISLQGNYDGTGNTNPTNLLITGNLIYNDGNNQTGYILQNNAAGIAEWTSPSSMFSSPWTVNNNDIYNNNNGKVGIGTTNPNYQLSVEQNAGSTSTNLSNFILNSQASTGANSGIYVNTVGSGTGNYIGTYSQVSGSSGGQIAVKAFATSTSTSNSGIETSAIGNTSGTNYGIRAEATNGNTNWAGYFGNGNVFIQNQLGLGTTTPLSRLHVDDPNSDAVTITTDWKLTMQHYNPSYATSNMVRPYLQKGWDFSKGDFMYIGATGNRDNDEQSAILMTQLDGIRFGTGNNSGNNLTTEWVKIENGNVGIGTSNPDNNLDVVGTFQYKDGNQGAGKILTSDSDGNTAWASNSIYTESSSLNTSSVTATTTWTGIGSSFNVTKVYDDSKIEVTFNSNVTSGVFASCSAVKFEIRIDGSTGNHDTKAVIRSSSTEMFLSMFAVFEGLSAGTYSVQIFTKTNTGSSFGVLLDPGGYGGRLIAKETF